MHAGAHLGGAGRGAARGLTRRSVLAAPGSCQAVSRATAGSTGAGPANPAGRASRERPINDRAFTPPEPPHRAVTPVGLNHPVLNVRDIEELYRFWTEILGFRQVGQMHASAQWPNPPKMRFYSGDRAGGTHHHDIALAENPDLPAPPAEWRIFNMPCAVNHIAIALPSREA